VILLSTTTAERAQPYLAALAAAGAGEVRVLTPDLPAAGAAALAAGANGLLLCGGADVEPDRYAEPVLPEAHVESDPRRDALEWALLEGGRQAAVPTLAICRGLQVVNVFFGGSLWQDLPLQLSPQVVHDLREPRDRLAHPVRKTTGAGSHPLGELFGGGPLEVNSRHHQGIRRLADGFVPLALAGDGLIEAVATRADDPWWLLGVQWHPENLAALPPHLALFHAFARAAARETAAR
jgi:putative glutamine amidotransferase